MGGPGDASAVRWGGLGGKNDGERPCERADDDDYGGNDDDDDRLSDFSDDNSDGQCGA